MVKEIKTIEDIINVVNEENLLFFLEDLKNFLILQIAVKTLESKNLKLEKKTTKFKWIDNGKNDIDINIRIKRIED